MSDLKLIESGNGGDLVLLGNDLAMIGGLQNMPYLASWGGNPEQSTAGPKIADQQAFDWWGNNLLYPNKSAIQFNSLLEKKLLTVVLSSQGRQEIEQTIKKDLAFMTAFSGVTVDVSIVSNNRIDINIKLQEPNNNQSTELNYIWDSTNQELTTA